MWSRKRRMFGSAVILGITVFWSLSGQALVEVLQKIEPPKKGVPQKDEPASNKDQEPYQEGEGSFEDIVVETSRDEAAATTGTEASCEAPLEDLVAQVIQPARKKSEPAKKKEKASSRTVYLATKASITHCDGWHEIVTERVQQKIEVAQSLGKRGSGQILNDFDPNEIREHYLTAQRRKPENEIGELKTYVSHTPEQEGVEKILDNSKHH